MLRILTPTATKLHGGGSLVAHACDESSSDPDDSESSSDPTDPSYFERVSDPSSDADPKSDAASDS